MNYQNQNYNAEVLSPGAVMSQNFTGQTLQQSHGTADTAMAAQIKAQVEARYLMAMHRPRDLDQVRERLLMECRRPHFATTALYSIPRGGSRIEGLTIRFAETAVRCMTNINCETLTLYDDKQKRILRVQVTDCESNQTFSRDITVEKSVERKRLGKGQEILGSRANSFGDTVYLVAATEDELNTKEAAIVSKTLRTLILRIIPGWLQDEAKEMIAGTARAIDAKDPDAQKKRVLDAFSLMGIGAVAIKDFLGRDQLDPMSPDELMELRNVHTAIKEGQAKWIDVLSERRASRQEQEPEAKAALPEGNRSKQTLAKLKKAAGKDEAEAVQTKPEPEPRAKEDVATPPWANYLEEKPEGLGDD